MRKKIQRLRADSNTKDRMIEDAVGWETSHYETLAIRDYFLKIKKLQVEQDKDIGPYLKHLPGRVRPARPARC